MGCTSHYASLDQYLAENIEAKGLVLLSRKRFWCDQKDTSAFSKRADCPHTLFFEAFKAQSIILDKEENVSIHPVFLAKAFLQKDIYKIAKELSSAIFTQADLKRRNEMLQRGITEPNILLNEFPPRKIDLIERMTKWIYEKQNCPWVISPDHLKQVEKWTQENKIELDKIYEALLSFDKISDFREYGLPASDFNQNDPAVQQWVNNEWEALAREEERRLRDPNFIPPNSDTIYQGTPQDVAFQRIRENWNYEKIFKEVIAEMERGSLVRCTTADLVRALTLATAPRCDDVFSGATQFTIDRWLKVQRYFTRGEGPAKMAEILFRKFRFDFEKKTFTDVDKDFCPIKFLDITRAVAKLMQKESGDSHNKFLNWETIDEIKRFLNEKYKGKRYNPSTLKFEAYYCDGEESTPSTMGNRNNEPQNSEANNWEERMETDGVPLFAVPVPTENVELGTSENVILPIGNLDNVILVHIETVPFSQPANMEVGLTVPFSQPANIELGPTVPFSQPANIKVGPTVPFSQPANIEVGLTVPQTAKINYCFDDGHNLILLDFFGETPVKVGFDDWKEVINIKEKNFQNRVIGRNVRRGKKLFDKLFTSKEKKMQHSTRDGRTKYPQYKVNAIFAIVSILWEMDNRPEEFQGLKNCEGPPVYELTQIEKGFLTPKIFYEHGYQQRRPKSLPKSKKKSMNKRGSSKREKMDHDQNTDSEV